MSDAQLAESFLWAIKESPGISMARLAKDHGLSQVQALRMLGLLAVPGGIVDGPALVQLDRKSDTSMNTRASLTPAGESLWET